jgi:hypothetical protein
MVTDPVSKGFLVYHLEVSSTEVLTPVPYEYLEGDKYHEYRATSTVVLPGGQLALSTGLNGDLQVLKLHFIIPAKRLKNNRYSTLQKHLNPIQHNMEKRLYTNFTHIE